MWGAMNLTFISFMINLPWYLVPRIAPQTIQIVQWMNEHHNRTLKTSHGAYVWHGGGVGQAFPTASGREGSSDIRSRETAWEETWVQGRLSELWVCGRDWISQKSVVLLKWSFHHIIAAAHLFWNWYFFNYFLETAVRRNCCSRLCSLRQ